MSSAASDSFNALFGQRRTTSSRPDPDSDDLLYHTATATREEWRTHRDGPLHRRGGPALIAEDSDSGLSLVEYRRHGVLDRADGPAQVKRSGGRYEERWESGGRLQRSDGPAHTVRWADGQWTEWFCMDGEQRSDGMFPSERSGGPGGEHEEKYLKDGLLHRSDGPAHTYACADGEAGEEWWWMGEQHRSDGPARVMVTAEGTETTVFYRHGKRHREDGPAIITKHANGAVIEEYYRDDERHCADAPAYRMTTPDGWVREQWWQNGELHRSDGPAIIEVDPNTGLRLEEHYRHGTQHRDDGPSYVEVHADGLRRERYHQHGKVIRTVQIAPDGEVQDIGYDGCEEPNMVAELLRHALDEADRAAS